MLCAEVEDVTGPVTITATMAIQAGRCLALAGPSGAGKTTILRMLAGTRRPAHGTIRNGEDTWLDTRTGAWVPAERRRCGYVFQEYALFPHLSAWRNVAFGMRRSTDRAGVREAAIAWLDRLGLGPRAQARPGVLSGGERQRVALARALASDPSVLLLDEPLAALDSSSRAVATGQLAEVLRTLAVPAVLVTHDFVEAATLGDEVGVLEGGRIVQRGTAGELSSAPASAFVADFTGAVVLTGVGRRGPEGLTVVELDGGGLASTTDSGSGHVALSILPWEIGVSAGLPVAADSLRNRLPARVVSITRLGNRVRLGLIAGQRLSAEITAEALSDLGIEVGAEVTAMWKATATRLVSL